MLQIYQYNRYGRLLHVWSSPEEASEMTDISQESIIKCCENRALQTGGYVWSYLPKSS
jgi:hypothetical protein